MSFTREEFKGFVNLVNKRRFEERTWDTAFAKKFFEDAKARIAKEG